MSGMRHTKHVSRDKTAPLRQLLSLHEIEEVNTLFVERLDIEWNETRVSTSVPVACEVPEDNHGYAFRLFAPRNGSTNDGITRIRLDSPHEGQPKPSTACQRSRSYYFKEALSEREVEQLRSVAVTGEQILEGSKFKGDHVALRWREIEAELRLSAEPWSVEDQYILYKVSAWLEQVPTVPQTKQEHLYKVVSVLPGTKSPWLEKIVFSLTEEKRSRPGKRSRLATRKRLQTIAEEERMAKIAAVDSALADRMKKSKKNRNKKLRQREKEKEKKAAMRRQDF